MTAVARTSVLPLVVVALVLAGCGATDNHAPPAATQTMGPEVSAAALLRPSEFAAAIAEPNRTTINVHVPFEGAIADTDLSIPYDQITQQATKLPADRSSPLAIYCRTGRMSVIAATTLKGLGYTNVVELQGGMLAWESSGRSLLPR